jgi:hypothetical protein
MKKDPCPFSVGQSVVYRPTGHGRGWIIMTDLADLVPRNTYKIVRIEKEDYVVVEGFENTSCGGLFWTEFSAK